MRRPLDASVFRESCAFVALLCISLGIASAAPDLTVDEIAAGITNSRDLLREYRCNYTVKETAPYVGVLDRSVPEGEIRHLRLDPLSEGELASEKRLRTYTYTAKGSMFSFEVRVLNDMPRRKIHEEYSRRLAFDGKRYLSMTAEDGSCRGTIGLPDQISAALSPLYFRPEDFFAEMTHVSLAEWLRRDPVVIHKETDTILGSQCYVAECWVGTPSGMPLDAIGDTQLNWGAIGDTQLNY